ncbi:Antizyme inhibitor 2 [Gracilariopsis chorda]|uniref:ornithine decarboxylase n=1 Tax=Gracilariopsis chorda TaxID=448386 RepID=A0A2V3IYX3_9FLOR|nr:Antizyme inhibitor 2 [Gracilariopsis chorda]|eukprot:PXF47348.1 Antizyme inhibitor 2 [Gracilariopsis chorda]
MIAPLIAAPVTIVGEEASNSSVTRPGKAHTTMNPRSSCFSEKSCNSLSSCSDPVEILKKAAQEADGALYAADFGKVAKQLHQFQTCLPDVTPYYAVKCNPDPHLINFLAQLGLSFDCASRREIDIVRRALGTAHGRNVLDERIVFANPFKAPEDLGYARALGVSLMTFDCIDELKKIQISFPEARLLLRIATDDSQALCPLSAKFGAHMEDVSSILRTVQEYSLNLVGVSFHVGSGCNDVKSYVQALSDARFVFDMATQLGMSLSVLDIGGGFPGFDGDTDVTFQEIADVVRPVLQAQFSQVRLIAEPGRFFAACAYQLAVKVILALDGEKKIYFLADGITGSFRDAHVLKIKFPAKVLLHQNAMTCTRMRLCDLRGPSRDAVDFIARDVVLPELQTGDWLLFENMGAYTMSLATRSSSGNRYQVLYCFGANG